MPTYNTGVFRDVVTPDPREMPQTVARDVIQVAVQSSALMQHARRQLMPARTWRAPVLNALPTSYWLDGTVPSNGHTQNDATDGYDYSLKQTTSYSWANVTLTAHEMAVLVPVSDAYVNDTGVDLLNEMKPLIGQEFGRRIDAAGLFGIGWAPSWGAATQNIYTSALAKGNVIKTGGTLAADTPWVSTSLSTSVTWLRSWRSRASTLTVGSVSLASRGASLGCVLVLVSPFMRPRRRVSRNRSLVRL